MTATEYHDRRARIADAWAFNRRGALHWAQWARVCPPEKKSAMKEYLKYVRQSSAFQEIMQAEGIPFEGQFR